MLSIIDVAKYAEHHMQAMKEGEQVYKNGLVLCVGVYKKAGPITFCQGICNPGSNEVELPYVIEIAIDKNKEYGERIVKGSCSCEPEEPANCKHFMALLIHLTRHEERELEDLSSADMEQQWEELKKCNPRDLEGCRISELCHVKGQHDIYVSEIPELTEEQKRECREKLFSCRMK